MADVRCGDGSRLSVLPVPVLDRDGTPYEVVLRLERDGAAFGEVGQRCGWLLQQARLALDAAPDGVLLDLRSRDPDDPATVGELRLELRTARRWRAGRWHAERRAVLDAWGDAGLGVRAVLSPAEAADLLDALLAEVAVVSG